jgi:hypothetical protein
MGEGLRPSPSAELRASHEAPLLRHSCTATVVIAAQAVQATLLYQHLAIEATYSVSLAGLALLHHSCTATVVIAVQAPQAVIRIYY